MKVLRIEYNWQPSGKYESFQVGFEKVIDIFEYPAIGEGDKWRYDIIFEKGDIIRIFNINKVYYEK